MAKPATSTKAKKIEQARLDAIVAHLGATSGPVDSASLARSYGLDESRVIEILKSLGRNRHG